MNKQHVRAAVVALVGTALLSGCATKGQLRRGLEEQRAALEAERAERIAADQRLQGDVQALRADLEGLRSDFGAQITALEEGVRFAMPVHFGFDDARVRDADRPVLDRFAQVVQRHYPGTLITVEGFADPAGSAAYNRALSQRRAESVRQYLVGLGMPDTRLRTVGYGEDRQVVPGAAASEYGAELNRRVVFVVETPADAALPQQQTTTPTTP